MKTLLYSVILFIATGAPSWADQQTVFARVTVYWRSEGCGLRAFYNGARLHDGHCAVDPKKIPFGSTIIFPDGPCLAVDTGPDVVNRRAARKSGRNKAERNALVVDRYFEKKKDALDWVANHPKFMTLAIIDRRETGGNRVAANDNFAAGSPPTEMVRKLPIPFAGCVIPLSAD